MTPARSTRGYAVRVPRDDHRAAGRRGLNGVISWRTTGRSAAGGACRFSSLARSRIRLPAEDLPLLPLPFEPLNEHGVVLLFGRYAEELGFRVESVRAKFPDCKATYHGQRVRIEFELESGNFEKHGHRPSGADLIVCWRHRWPNPGRRYRNKTPQVLELRRFFGRGWGAWLQGLHSEYADELPGGGLFSVASRAGPDDLVLVYRPRDDSSPGEIRELARVASPVEMGLADHTGENDWMAELQVVARLKNPLTLDDIASVFGVPRTDLGLRLRRRRSITKLWPAFRRRILRKNPDLRTPLDAYPPTR